MKVILMLLLSWQGTVNVPATATAGAEPVTITITGDGHNTVQVGEKFYFDCRFYKVGGKIVIEKVAGRPVAIVQ